MDLPDEVLLCIASFLDPAALASLAECSRHWYRLAKHPQLWKTLFYDDFVKPGLGIGPSTLPTLPELRSLLVHQRLPSDKYVRGDGREIVKLPRRFYRWADESDEIAPKELAALFNGSDQDHNTKSLDWEQLYRVTANWQAGKYVNSELPTAHSLPRAIRLAGHDLIARSSANFVFLSRGTLDQGTGAPVVDIFKADPQENCSGDLLCRTPIGQLRSSKLAALLADDSGKKETCVTDIAIDIASESSNLVPSDRESLRVLVSYTGGHFALFLVSTSASVIDELFHNNTHPTTMSDVTASALHSSALVLCSKDFNIRIFQLLRDGSRTRVRLAQQLSSYRSSSPAAIRLKRIPFRLKSTSQTSSDGSAGEEAFRLTVAYATPAYPSSWTIGVQEVVVRLVSGSAESATASSITSRHVNARHAYRESPINLRGTSLLASGGAPRLRTSLPWTFSSQLSGAETTRMTSLSYDDPFIVMGANNNVLEVYELHGATTHITLDSGMRSNRSATATPESPKDTLRLTHLRSLHGHTGSVQSVALEDGRCVSGGADGSVMVWNLGERINEADSIASVVKRHKGSHHPRHLDTRSDITSTDAADHPVEMTHVLTLQPPSRSHAVSEAEERQLHIPSYREILADSDHSRGIVRWVSTTFDKIISIIRYSEASTSDPSLMNSRERVQIWNFG